MFPRKIKPPFEIVTQINADNFLQQNEPLNVFLYSPVPQDRVNFHFFSTSCGCHIKLSSRESLIINYTDVSVPANEDVIESDSL